MFFNAVYCLPANTAVSLNGYTESYEMQITACRPAQLFVKTEILKNIQCNLLPDTSTAVSLNGNTEISKMQFTACQHIRFFKWKYGKIFNAVYCLPASTAICLNRITESPTMQFTACRPAQPFLKRKY
jgi:hypothetical protein